MKRKDHISLISSKVSRVIGTAKYAERVVPSNFLKMLYLGLVFNLFNTCASYLKNIGSEYQLIHSS